MASEAVGGLYVAVGIKADGAIASATMLQDRMQKIAQSITALNKSSDLDQLTAKMEKLAAAAAKVQNGVAKAAPSVPSPAAPAAPRVPGVGKQVTIDAEALALRLQQNKDFVQRIIASESKKNLSVEQQTRLSAARESALRLRQGLDEQRIDEATYNKKMALLRTEVGAVEKAVQQQVRAQNQITSQADKAAQLQVRAQREVSAAAERTAAIQVRASKQAAAEAEKAAQQQVRAQKQIDAAMANRGSLGRVASSGAQDLFTGLGAARSGNYFYGLAAFSRYFKNVSSEMVKFKGAAGGAAGGLNAVGGAAGGASAGLQSAATAMVALKVGAVAAFAVVPLVGIALTGVGVKIAEAGLKQASSLELLKIQYEGLLGSARAAGAEVSRVLQLGTTSIVPTEQLLDANRLLLAFGVTAQGTRTELLEFIAAFSSVTGASLTQVQNLSYALGQINAAGKANAIDLRQLANAGISTADIFKSIAEQQGISVDEAKQLSDDGKLYASVIIPAILARTKDLAAAQEKARNSAYGIIVNLKDIANIKLGAAFGGLLESLKPVLKWVESFIKAFDFRIIAQSFQNVVGYFKEAFAGMGSDAADTARGISQTIAQAVNIVGYAAVVIAQVVVAVFNSVMVGVNFVWAGIQDVIAKILYGVSGVMEKAALIPGPWQEAARSIADSSWLMAEEVSKGADIAGNAWVASANNADGAWSSVFSKIASFKPLDLRDFNKLGAEGPKGKPAPAELTFDPPPVDTTGGGAGKAVAAWIEMMKKLIKSAAEASKNLAESLTLPFAKAIAAGGGKMKTAAEEAFTSMDIKTIVSKFTEMRDQIVDLYAPMENLRLAGSSKMVKAAKAQRKSLIAELRGQTYELVRLASDTLRLTAELEAAEKALEKVEIDLTKRREAITAQYAAQQKKIAQNYDNYFVAVSATEGRLVKGAITLAQEALDAATGKYEKAREQLDSLREARTSFLDSLKDTVRSYVNNLSGVATEIEKYTRLDDFGSFALTKSSQVDFESFKKSLSDRLDALRTWRVQVQNLMSRGLDSDFLQSIVSGGPEASKDVVASLAGASDSELAALNNVQKQLSEEILSLQNASSQQWFDAGIAAQEAFTAPLKAAYDAAQKQVSDLTTQKDLALGVLEAWYTEQNELIDAENQTAIDRFNAVKADLEAKMTANEVKATELANAITGLWNKLPNQSYMTGVAVMDRLLEGLQSKEKELVKEAKRIADRITDTIAGALRVNSPSKVMIDIGESVGEGLAVGMANSAPNVDRAAFNLTDFSLAFSTLPSMPDPVEAAPPLVKVFIGDRELTDIVDVRIEDASRADRDLVIAGRRY